MPRKIALVLGLLVLTVMILYPPHYSQYFRTPTRQKFIGYYWLFKPIALDENGNIFVPYKPPGVSGILFQGLTTEKQRADYVEGEKKRSPQISILYQAHLDIPRLGIQVFLCIFLTGGIMWLLPGKKKKDSGPPPIPPSS